MDVLANELLKSRLNRYIFLGLLLLIFTLSFFPSLWSDLISREPEAIHAQDAAGGQLGGEDINSSQSSYGQMGGENINNSSNLPSSDTTANGQLGGEDIQSSNQASSNSTSDNRVQDVAGGQQGGEDINFGQTTNRQSGGEGINAGGSNSSIQDVAGGQLGGEDINTPSNQSGSQIEDVAGGQLGGEQINPNPVVTKPALTSTEHGMCMGSHAWWVREWSNGQIDWIKDWGQQPGECGNPVSQPAPAQAQTVTAQTTPVTHNGTSYPQCGGTAGLESFPSNHTIIVTPVLDSNGNVMRYDHDDKGVLAGQCGNPTMVQVVTPVTTPALVVSTAACNEDVVYYDPNVGRYIHKHGGRLYNPASVYETQAKDANGCIYAFDQVSAPMVTTCKGQISEEELESQLHGANYPGPYGLQYQSAEVEAYNHAACPPVTPTPTPTAIVTNISCPSGTTATMSGNSVVCVSTTPAVSGTPAPAITRQLPQTGVPLAGVSLAGLVPLGLKLRQFSRDSEKNSGQSIWKDREFKSVLK